jgi:hypothetical protein
MPHRAHEQHQTEKRGDAFEHITARLSGDAPTWQARAEFEFLREPKDHPKSTLAGWSDKCTGEKTPGEPPCPEARMSQSVTTAARPSVGFLSPGASVPASMPSFVDPELVGEVVGAGAGE